MPRLYGISATEHSHLLRQRVGAGSSRRSLHSPHLGTFLTFALLFAAATFGSDARTGADAQTRTDGAAAPRGLKRATPMSATCSIRPAHREPEPANCLLANDDPASLLVERQRAAAEPKVRSPLLLRNTRKDRGAHPARYSVVVPELCRCRAWRHFHHAHLGWCEPADGGSSSPHSANRTPFPREGMVRDESIFPRLE